MATLTETEITAIRQRIGDSQPDTANGFDLTSDEIQAEWDRANGHDSDENAYLAYYYMLERRYGIWLNSVDTETQEGNRLQNQKLRNIERAIDRYRELSGKGNFTLSVSSGVFDLAIDQDTPTDS